VITFERVSKSFGATQAISDFSLRIEDGALCALIGPSGCGKSTVLRMVNAMVLADTGKVEINGEDIRRLDPVELRRRIGYVIQSVGLFPHWTVAENIAAVPRLLGWSAQKRSERIDQIVDLLHIDPSLLPRYPHQLSGGQQQRIGVARALAADPEIVLMDEPFAALDPVSRATLQDELRSLHAQSGKTIAFVTHDMDEALRIATHMVVMDQGHVVQTGTPTEILTKPANPFVREFLGGEKLEIKLLDVTKVRDRLTRITKTAARTAIAPDASLKDALNLMLAQHVTSLRVEDEKGTSGEISLADIFVADDAR
jgi:osmoprotectant transport system ATP-binding protein